MNKKSKWNLVLPCIILVVVAAVLIIKRDELGEFVNTIASANIVFIALAAICLFGRYLSHAWMYKGIYECVGEKVPYKKILPLVFSVTFVNDMAPTAGTAGSVFIAAWSSKQGMDMGKSMSVVFIEKIGFFGGFFVVMTIGAAVLIMTGQLQWYIVVGALLMFIMIGISVFVLYYALDHEKRLAEILGILERFANNVSKKARKKEMKPWAEKIAEDFHKASILLTQNPKKVAVTFARGILLHACDCLCFICVAQAFAFEGYTLAIAAYVAGFIIATFILQTVGAVEILLALVLTAYGSSPAQAAAISLVYRGLIFWVPFLIGAVCFNFAGKTEQDKVPVGKEINEVLEEVEAREDAAQEVHDLAKEPSSA